MPLRRCYTVQFFFVQLASQRHCNVTYLTTAENVARQVAETVAESRTRSFLQRFQATRFSSLPSVNACTLRDKLHETLHSATAPSRRFAINTARYHDAFMYVR